MRPNEMKYSVIGCNKETSDLIKGNNNIMYSTMRAYNIKKRKKSSSCKSNSTS
jgi:hypothetical protein